MYSSPIQIIMDQIKTEQKEMVIRAVQKVGIDVDTEELKKALQYDRNQYEKGYADAVYANAPVGHAHWILDNPRSDTFNDYYKCSRCGRYIVMPRRKELSVECPYCHCGAKMDEEVPDHG